MFNPKQGICFEENRNYRLAYVADIERLGQVKTGSALGTALCITVLDHYV